MTDATGSRSMLRRAPLIGAAVLLFIMFVAYLAMWKLCLEQTPSHFTYALDDPYIHLAIAKNIANYGVWGVTRFHPASASSSPLWTIALALWESTGDVSVFGPLLLGGAISMAAVLVAYRALLRQGFSAVAAAATGFVLFVVAPLFVLPFSGMEHSLQILLDIVFSFWILSVFDRTETNRDLAIGALVGALMCLCRYESVFLLFVPIAAAAWRRRWKLLAGLILGPILGIGGFGLYSHSVGMPWVPNSILLKGNVPHTSPFEFVYSLGNRIVWTYWDRGRELAALLILAIAVLAVLRLKALRAVSGPVQLWLATAIVAAILHAGFAMIGFFFRYEGYLLTLTAIGIALGLKVIWTHSTASTSPKVRAGLAPLLYGCPLLLVIATASRAESAIQKAPNGCRDIYTQQYQMARFIGTYYPNGRIGANDIGAITFFNDVRLLDLVGLATDSIRRYRMNRTYNTAAIDREVRHFKPDLVVIYPSWFPGSLSMPASLIPVADWTIPPTTTAASDTVRFYAMSRAAAKTMSADLKQFKPRLPPEVHVTFLIR